jgi:hypothetical protein
MLTYPFVPGYIYRFSLATMATQWTMYEPLGHARAPWDATHTHTHTRESHR